MGSNPRNVTLGLCIRTRRYASLNPKRREGAAYGMQGGVGLATCTKHVFMPEKLKNRPM